MSESTSTISSAGRNYRRSRSRSILSSGSDIRFTRKKLTSQYKCGCAIVASFLVLLLVAAAALYLGYNYLASELPGPEAFRGSFKVIEGDIFSAELSDPTNTHYKVKTRDYKERLNLLFKKSNIRYGFLGTDILALDGIENKDLVVHFVLSIDPTYVTVDSKVLENIILNDLKQDLPILFRNIKIDPTSLVIFPDDLIPEKSSQTTTEIYEVVKKAPEDPRHCVQSSLKYCSRLRYNSTSYPNIFGHKNVVDVEQNIIPFRELIDSECYDHTYEFVCNVLQPSCKHQNVNILPCKSFCKYFMGGCGSRLPKDLKHKLNCDNFVDYDNENCIVEPDCGIQKTRKSKILPKTAQPGDWPWHVALFKEKTHTCDGTLVSPNWVATTSSCFQGQPKAEWIAKFGISVLHSNSTTQERRILGMLKSPVEGSTIALVRLDRPVMLSDIVRPVCLPTRTDRVESGDECNTLGWGKNGQLKRIQIQFTDMAKCEHTSISTLNNVCGETLYGTESCQEEELAGTSVMCLNSQSKTWNLVGITNWRITCLKNGMERPRMYDKISSNINWIHETMNSEI